MIHFDTKELGCVHGHIPPPECLACTIAERDAQEADNYELMKRLQKAEGILEELGYRRCDIAACNCGGYHHTCEEPEV